MVTIKEAEMQTGITKQNIRYYEKIGLLQPSREQENKYRNYSEEDIRRLKLIVLFRKLDMPLEEIRNHRITGCTSDAERDACGKTAEAAGGNFFLRTDRGEGAYTAGCGRVSE